jgi:GNAT superfamily N-acetyltransferase
MHIMSHITQGGFAGQRQQIAPDRRIEVEGIEYAIEPRLSVVEFVDLLRRSTLAERRPVDQPETIAGMLTNADLIVTARLNEQLVGVARSLTDFSYCTYLSDLAVDEAFQRRGIGQALIRRSHDAAGSHTTLILLSAPAARDYYPHIGMRQHDSCWVGDRVLEHNER